MENGRLAMHFGHCESFALIDVDRDSNRIVNQETVTAPPHQPGFLPAWLADFGAQMIIAGGMGGRAIEMFQRQGIEVVLGAPADAPEQIVTAWLKGQLASGANACDGGGHGRGGGCGRH
jgi:predicted Fe-Mo cluster-binding NifX family protein